MKDTIERIVKSDIIAKIAAFDAKRLIAEARKRILSKRRKKKRGSDKGQRSEFIMYQKPKSPIAEAYRMLRTNIQHSGTGKRLKSIVVTSSGPREGKTTTVVNLGCAFAQDNKKTLIVDSDLRNTSFHRLFKLDNSRGLTSIIMGQKSIDEAVHKDILIPNLDILTSGPRITNPAEAIGSKALVDFINAVKAVYDMIIFDSPPTLAVTDAKLLSFHTGGVILVIQSSRMAKEVARRAIEGLREVNANIIGAVLNNLDTTRENYYYYYRYYYSYYAKEGVKEGVGEKAPKAPLEKKPEERPDIKQEPVIGQEPVVEKKADIFKKKNLFIPDSHEEKIEDRISPAGADNIITMLSKEEKKENKRVDIRTKRSPDKESALGKKTIFLKGPKRPAGAEKPDKNKEEGKSGLGKKDIFKDL